MGFGDHLERFLPGRTQEEIAPAHAALREVLPRFRVRTIAPEKPGERWVYATCGASQSAADGEDGAEYVLLASTEDPVLVEMLGSLASLNADPQRRVGVGSLLALGRPWTAGAQADHLLVLPPYPFGEGFEVCELDGRRVVVLWIVPVTSAEAQFVREEGYEVLEQLIAREVVDLADPARPSIV